MRKSVSRNNYTHSNRNNKCLVYPHVLRHLAIAQASSHFIIIGYKNMYMFHTIYFNIRARKENE